MPTVEQWNPYGVLINVTANPGTVTRISATQFTVSISASWTVYWSGASTNYGMIASSGGNSVTLNSFGNYASKGSGSFTGTYSISGNGAQSKGITVSFRHFNPEKGQNAYKDVSFSVSVPAWTSYTVSYNANGGSGAPSSQTKWKDQGLTLSSAKPTNPGFTFIGWATTSTATDVEYYPGGTFHGNYSVTLYAVWSKNKTMTLSFNTNDELAKIISLIHVAGKSTTIIDIPHTRPDYYFLGWSTKNNGAVEYRPGDRYTNDSFVENSTVELYAVWERKKQILLNIPDGQTVQGVFVKVPDGTPLTEIYIRV